ncbi:MFS transporter [Gordonia sp. NPDC003504]
MSAVSAQSAMRNPSVRHHQPGLAVGATWAVGALAYLVAITNRTSMSALGIDTAHHFSIDPATLSLFAVIQLGVYGVAQIPVGMALDRYGSRAVLTVGVGLMAVSQVVLAAAPSVWIAIAARVLLGAGDAAVFPCVLRIIGIRFPRRSAPLMVQITAVIGQLGQVVSIIPFAHLVHAKGWQSGFLLLAATAVLVAVLSAVFVSDGRRPTTTGVSGSAVGARLRASITEPGTRLAFWTHFVTPFSANTFGVLWGFPFLVAGEGVPESTARTVLVTSVLVGVVAGPVLGLISARFPARRVHLVVGLVAGQVLAWGAVLLYPGTAPHWVLYLLAMAIGAGGPASIVAFDFAREYNPTDRLSTATGIVNAGGFLASVIAILLIGLTLNLTSDSPGVYDPASFRVAMLWQIPLWLVGTTMVCREYRRTRAARSPSRVPGD